MADCLRSILKACLEITLPQAGGSDAVASGDGPDTSPAPTLSGRPVEREGGGRNGPAKQLAFSKHVLGLAPVYLLFIASCLHAQGTRSDYQRANGFRELTRNKVSRDTVKPHWLPEKPQFWYRVDTGEDARFDRNLDLVGICDDFVWLRVFRS
jgi:hypothetical protein